MTTSGLVTNHEIGPVFFFHWLSNWGQILFEDAPFQSELFLYQLSQNIVPNLQVYLSTSFEHKLILAWVSIPALTGDIFLSFFSHCEILHKKTEYCYVIFCLYL